MASNEDISVGVLDARNRFSELIRRVVHGATVTVTRHGQPIVRLVPARPEVNQAEIDEMLAGARRLRASAAFTTSWRESKRDRDEGRRF
ncbi:type II toxin-antitoxin system Phd/YefM family antitoxin [Brevundimonas sp.]|uniref:type II toxin-antitoxin system Phd/YefM family antitoxin n=1 Tax=Brevundimonas sp. TaxID=1871086 RepID=UPI003A8D53FC